MQMYVVNHIPRLYKSDIIENSWKYNVDDAKLGKLTQNIHWTYVITEIPCLYSVLLFRTRANLIDKYDRFNIK